MSKSKRQVLKATDVDANALSAKSTIRWLQGYYAVPRRPRVTFNPAMLARYDALGLYDPRNEQIVLASDRVETPDEMITVFIEWLHHACPAMHHEGE